MGDLTRGVKNDMQYIDGRAVWRLTHHDGGTHDYAEGTFTPVDVYTDIPNCVKRSPADRQLASTRQIQQRMESIQNDLLNTTDVVLEIPGGYDIAEGDTIQELDDDSQPVGPNYLIVSNDRVNFLSRNRLGCRTMR